MKRIFFFIIIFLNISVCLAQNYEVYKVTGKVVDSQTKKDLRVHDKISLRTELTISDNGSVGVIEKSSNRIYFGYDEGKITVAEIIRKAKKKSDSAIATINSQIARAAHEDATPTKARNMGVSARGEHDDEVTQRTYKGIKSILSGDEKVITETSENLVLSALFVDADIFYFYVSNLTENTLYVNILNVSAQGDVSLCLNFDNNEDEPFVRLNPGVSVELEDYLFVQPKEQSQYILFATSIPFDSHRLSTMILGNEIIDDNEKSIPIFTATINM